MKIKMVISSLVLLAGLVSASQEVEAAPKQLPVIETVSLMDVQTSLKNTFNNNEKRSNFKSAFDDMDLNDSPAAFMKYLRLNRSAVFLSISFK